MTTGCKNRYYRMSRIDETAQRECGIKATGIAVSQTEAESAGLSFGHADTRCVYLACPLQAQVPHL